jgi:LuxR family maltose regulon positive regulatory protein
MATDVADREATGARRSAVRSRDLILTAMLTAPGVPDWAVKRPRISKQIAQGVRLCPLTVVTGPLGAGKTMALALWAAAERGPVAWLSLDEYDNRPNLFWSYVVAALRRSGAVLPKTLSAAARGRRSAEHMFLLRLASALAAQNPPVTLVIDDFHLLAEPQVLNALDFLLRNAGTGLRLVVCSRTDPLLPLHRYRLTGQLAEIRASDLAFTTAEAHQLLAQHSCTPSADSLTCLTRLTEGWAAGLRLAAMSMADHPNPERFVEELLSQDSALTSYLVKEVLNTLPPKVRELLLSTSILERVNAEAASELTGSEQAGRTLSALAHTNAFIQPIGGGWYRYHTLFAEMLRLRLRLESPDRIAALHRRAARWHERSGQLTGAVQHAAQAGDWPLAASIVINALAIGEILEPRGSQPLADEFAGMPHGEAWAEPQPYLVSAHALSANRPEVAATALGAAEDMLERLPADRKTASGLAAALVRLAACRRTGDRAAVVATAARAEALIGKISGGTLAQHEEIRARLLSARAAVEVWSGHLTDAARILDAGAAAAVASRKEDQRAACLGQLALVEAMRGHLSRAAKLAGQATASDRDSGLPPTPAALVALAWVHLEHHELREARDQLKRADAALGASRDELAGAVACLAAACIGLAEGHAEVAMHFVARARSQWSGPVWLEQKLSVAESRACLAAGDVHAAVAAAERAGPVGSPEAAVMLAYVWAEAGDGQSARRALEPLTAHDRVPERVRLQACLVDARLSYHSGDRARGRRSLGCALQLAARERLRLPFAMERSWIGPVLKHDPELAQTHKQLFTPAMHYDPRPAPPTAVKQATIPVLEPLTQREQEVLRHVSGMLTTAEIASEMYISTNTVKSHIRNVCTKLAVTHRGEAVRRARQLQMI